jgi:hypothetical protein
MIWRGPHDGVAEVWHASAFAFFPGFNERSEIALNGALNFAPPVVPSDRVVCASDVVADGESGFVLSHRDVQARRGTPEGRLAALSMRRDFDPLLAAAASAVGAKASAE